MRLSSRILNRLFPHRRVRHIREMPVLRELVRLMPEHIHQKRLQRNAASLVNFSEVGPSQFRRSCWQSPRGKQGSRRRNQDRQSGGGTAEIPRTANHRAQRRAK